MITEGKENRFRLIRVPDLEIPELEFYRSRRESQLAHCFEPEPGIFIAESPKVIERALDAGYEPVSVLAEENGETSALLRCMEQLQGPVMDGLPVYLAQHETIRELTGYPMTRGALCAMRRKPLPGRQQLDDLCGKARRIVILENVENPTNLGAIFRSAAALGMDAVLLNGGCSDPLYRRAIRVSMGTVFQIPWAFLPEEGYDWPAQGISRLRKMGFFCIAMALREESLRIEDEQIRSRERVAVVLGSEGDGLDERTIQSCDATVLIPMKHGVDSLNVSAAAAVAFWALAGRSAG